MWKRDLRIGMLCLTMVVFPADEVAAVERTKAGAREAGLAEAVVAVAGPFSIFYNPALLTEQTSWSFAASYRQPYLINGYHESALSVVCPVSTAVFAVEITQSSFASYKESNFGFSLAKVLTRKLSAALLFNYFTLNFPETGGHKGALQVDLGIRYCSSNRLALGAHLQNMVSSGIETYQYHLAFPACLSFGGSWLLTNNILLAGVMFYQKNPGIGIRTGIETRLGTNFRLRGGITSNPFQHSFGFGSTQKNIQIDFAKIGRAHV